MKKTILLTGMVIFIFSGCAGPHIENYYTAPRFSTYYVKDVGFLGFTSREDLPFDTVKKIEDIFLREMRKRNWYRIHLIDADDLDDFEKMKRIDTLLWGEVLYYKSTEPFRFGLTTQMKFINTNQTIWSAYYIFDASTQKTIDLLEDYYQRRLHPHSPLWGYRLYLLNIEKFMEFSCNSILDTIQLGLEEKVEKIEQEEDQTAETGAASTDSSQGE